MFRGINAISIDTKGRLSVPTRYREALTQTKQSPVVITIDTDAPCLLLYPIDQWECIEKKLVELPSFNPVARRIQRLLIGHATEIELDTSGRLLIPNVLREYAGLEKDCMMVGQGQKFEIWSATRWETCRNEWLQADLTQTDEMPVELIQLHL